MRVPVGLVCLFFAAAAEAADLSAPRIQVLEGRIAATFDCDAIPSSAEIAAHVAKTLAAEQQKAGVSRPVALLAAGQAIDPKALKIAFDLDVVFNVDNFDDGPRSHAIGLADKFWTGGDPTSAQGAAPLYWNVDAGCGYDLTDSIYKIIVERTQGLVAALKKSGRAKAQ